MVTKRYAGIGSREAPPEALRLARMMASILAELGYALYSGGCPIGMDFAFAQGAYGHRGLDKSHNRIYLSWHGMAGLQHCPETGFYDASRFPNYEQAREIGLRIRGSWERLGRGGIAHHSRNPYQVLGDDLNSPVDFVLTWAKPQGKQGHVKGGTGTAVKLALEHGIPVYNLYDPVMFSRVESLVNSIIIQKRMGGSAWKPLNERRNP